MADDREIEVAWRVGFSALIPEKSKESNQSFIKLAHQFWFSYPPPGGGSSRSQTDEEKKEKKEAAEALARAEHAQQTNISASRCSVGERKICDSDSIFSPEFKYDIGLSLSRKVSERQKNKGKLMNFEIPANSDLIQRFIDPPTEGRRRVSSDRHNISRQNSTEDET
ncbi:hypothetical protein L9F63_022661, partial [Diploptera punctata]